MCGFSLKSSLTLKLQYFRVAIMVFPTSDTFFVSTWEMSSVPARKEKQSYLNIFVHKFLVIRTGSSKIKKTNL